MIPYITTQSAASVDHDTIHDNDGIFGFVPNLMTPNNLRCFPMLKYIVFNHGITMFIREQKIENLKVVKRLSEITLFQGRLF